VDHTAFTSTMTMAAVVVNNGTEVRSDMIEIGAFAGDENRGSAVLKYEPSLDRYVGFLMIYGDGNEEIHLKVYDHEEEMEYAADNTAITFVAEGFFGVPNLYVVSIGTVFGEWSDWVVTKEPTCTEAGSRERTRTCAVSGDIDKQTEAIDALGHDWDEWTITKEPTCTEAGVQTAICKHDAEHAKTEEIDALGHDWGEWVVTPPTSTSDGDSTRVCLRDGSHIETVVISMLTWRQSIVDMINDIVTAPVDRLTNRLVAGPNPAAKSSGKIAFFREGELIKDATLIIYDANGNIVNRIKISDNASDLGKSRSGSAARRAVGEWNLKDAKNRPVGTGTYVVKGVLIGIDGRRETISLIVGVQ
ncbi:MAG: hypothetical protein FWE57_03205, partial [Chitinispirillia bacterium]|nr:hypothetical protein [Chitinispirillia bacterium]